MKHKELDLILRLQDANIDNREIVETKSDFVKCVNHNLGMVLSVDDIEWIDWTWPSGVIGRRGGLKIPFL